MKPWMIIVAVVVVLAVGGASFYGGMRFRESQILKDPSMLFAQMGGRQFGQGFPTGAVGERPTQGGAFVGGQGAQPQGAVVQGRGGTMGTIAAIDGGVLTLNTNDGSVLVQTADTTLVEKLTSVDVSELQVGESVMVSGSTNEDGSITARSIQSMRGLTGLADDASNAN